MSEHSVSEAHRASTNGGANAQRDRIRLAAVHLFTRQGFAGTSMKELARALETAPANIYNYYVNKEAILVDVLEFQLLSVMRRDEEIVSRHLPPAETLHALAHDLVVNDLNDPLAAFVGVQGLRGLSKENVAYISGLMSQIRSLWARVIADGSSTGVFRVIDPKLTALSILTLCSSVSTWYQPDGEYTADFIAKGVADLALGMVGVSAPDC